MIAALPQPSPLSSEVSATLTVCAEAAYEIFADTVEIPRWLPNVEGGHTLSRFPDGRPRRVAFTRKVQRGSLGYTLEYDYDPRMLSVGWSTPAGSNLVLTGEARFAALSARACLMLYRLVIYLPIVDDRGLPPGGSARGLPPGGSAAEGLGGELDLHPASHVVSEFREHLKRLC